METSHIFVALSILGLVIHTAFAQPIGYPPPRFTRKKYASVHGRRMAYVEIGRGDPIVFLHGNPSSSYEWRNVLPRMVGTGRLIAPDLIGHGDSDKLPPSDGPSRYTVLQHCNYLFALLEKLGVKRNVTLVLHDWGASMGFYWAYLRRKDPDAVRGIVFMEALVRPEDSKIRPIGTNFKKLLARPDIIRKVLQENLFIEQFLPKYILRNLTKAEMDQWRRPFKTPGDGRLPMITFPSEVPIDGIPRSTFKMVSDYSKWLGSTPHLPKLFIRSKNGIVITDQEVEFIRKSWPNVKEVIVKGVHFFQEDDPFTMGDTISEWISSL